MGKLGIEGYRVLITASTRGIGRGIAEVLLEEGARVLYVEDLESLLIERYLS